jgi:hypothetical protein
MINEDQFPLSSNPPYDLTKVFHRREELLPYLDQLLKEFLVQRTADSPGLAPAEGETVEMTEMFYEFFYTSRPLLYLLQEIKRLGKPEELAYYMTEDSPRPTQLPTNEVLNQLTSHSFEMTGSFIQTIGKPPLFVCFSAYSGPMGSLAPFTYIYRKDPN